jgi:predicted RNase H-like HicB family nuclease
MEEVVVGRRGEQLMCYAVVIEKANGNYSAYVPDLPGCVATGDTVAAVENEIREAIRFHIDGLQADGIVVPQPNQHRRIRRNVKQKTTKSLPQPLR